MRTFILITLGFIGLHTENVAISFIMAATMISVLVITKEVENK
jgi:hypothetical protein